MKALHLTSPNSLEVVEKPIPKPRKGQVLVKMAYSPINPSDLAFLTGNYGIKKPFPTVPGFEGSGEVIESGGGFYANYLKGKNVACVASDKLDGPWAEYMVTDAAKCVVIGKNVELQQGSMSFVNPLTALDFIKEAKAAKCDTIVMSAAASALSKMVHYLAQKEGLAFGGVVRREDQVNKLQTWGVDYVANTSEENWMDGLKEWSAKRKKVLFPDAIGGSDVPSKILRCLPARSKMLIYGSMNFEEPAVYIPRDFIFYEYEVAGYWLSKRAGNKTFLQALKDTRAVQQMLSAGFENDIQATFKPEEFAKALETYNTGMSKGKVLFDLT
ncbi:alcohol dehydrogenase catalytic domain-containing protein [Jiulongibacter sp. NS-SX5]|uniref:alcohol dehydrogenase catalytic domain-containing protein n=1 Tax=Jiulongibacter sp. NS-SX5 TaxID=3463854 RepID=UPI00405817F5